MMGSGCIKNCQSLKMNATIKYKKVNFYLTLKKLTFFFIVHFDCIIDQFE